MAPEKHLLNTDCDIKAGYLRFSDGVQFKSIQFLLQSQYIIVAGSLLKGRISWEAVEYIEFWKHTNKSGLFSIKFIEPAFSGKKIVFGRLDSDCWKEFMEKNLDAFRIREK